MLFRLTGSLALVALPLALLSAQEPAPRPWTLQTDFGFVNTAGNTSTTVVSAGEKASYLTGRWTLGQQFAAIYGRSNGTKNAESYLAGVRADYGFSKRVGLYLMGGWDRNEFAGISHRFQEGGGFKLAAVATERSTLDLEAGIAFDQEQPTSGPDQNFAAGRGALMFKQLFTTAAYFQQTAEVLPNLKHTDDVRVNSETAIVAPLSRSIAFKAAYAIRFDNQPEPGFKKTDRFLTSGLQVVF